MSETFIKIDSLQHLEISRQTYPTNRSKICVTTFTAIEFFRFSRIQTYRIFYFLRRLFAKHQTLSS